MRDGIRRVIFLLPILLPILFSGCSNPDPGDPAEGGPGRLACHRRCGPGLAARDAEPLDHGVHHGCVRRRARSRLGHAHPGVVTPEETSAVQDPPIGTCCVPAPVVTEFDPEGNIVQGWGDPATQDVSEFPRNAHGIFVDHNDYVWVGTYRHHRVMKFTRSGDLVMTIGRYDENAGSDDRSFSAAPPASGWTHRTTKSSSPTATRTVASSCSTAKREPTCATGAPTANRRTTPTSTTTRGGRRTRSHPASSPPCTTSSGRTDGLIYVADRRGNRIQVFDQDGAFLAREDRGPGHARLGSASSSPSHPTRRNAGSTWPTAPTTRSGSCAAATSRSWASSAAADASWASSCAPRMSVDSHGNIYVGEASTGRRIQRFTPR